MAITMIAAVSDVHAGSDYAPAPERIPWGHRVAIEDVGKCGFCTFIVDDGRLLEPEPILFQPDRPEVLEA